MRKGSFQTTAGLYTEKQMKEDLKFTPPEPKRFLYTELHLRMFFVQCVTRTGVLKEADPGHQTVLLKQRQKGDPHCERFV